MKIAIAKEFKYRRHSDVIPFNYGYNITSYISVLNVFVTLLTFYADKIIRILSAHLFIFFSKLRALQ